MASPFTDLRDQLDRRFVGAWVHGVSVPTIRTKRWLRGRRLPFIDPEHVDPHLGLAAVDRTADIVIDRYGAQAALLGGVAGMAGMASIPPELIASMVGVMRLGQRLCVVYGFDPETDRGQMALWQAFAHAYHLDLPPSGLVEMRASDLPSLLLTRKAPVTVSGTLTRAVVRTSALKLVGRFVRFVPVLAAISQASMEQTQFREVGESLKQSLRRLAEMPPPETPEDAIEL
jgi:hypothetical protein